MDQVISVIQLVSPWLGTLSVGVVGGIVLVVLNNRRPLLTFGVTHDRIGMTAEDQTHGKVVVMCRDQVMSNLYLSHLTITNRSIRDLKDLELKAWVIEGCQLLTESSGIENTIDPVRHTDEFVKRIEDHLEFEQNAKDEGNQNDPEVRKQIAMGSQFGLRQRWYTVPVLNRGQSLTISFLMNVAPDTSPVINVSCQNAGVRLAPVQYRRPVTHVWGVPVQVASITGLVLVLFAFPAIVYFVPSVWWASFICLVAGVLISVPGAFFIRSYWWVRAKIVG